MFRLFLNIIDLAILASVNHLSELDFQKMDS